MLSWVFMTAEERELWAMLVPRPYGNWGVFKGDKGIGLYSKDRNKYDDYEVLFYRPAGKGVRAGDPSYYRVVDRFTTRRKSKGKAIDRAYVLAHGRTRKLKPRTPTKTDESPALTAYCAKEKKHVYVDDWEAGKTKSGRDMLIGHCPDCGTQVQKFGTLRECLECGKLSEFAPNDYICKRCRKELDA